MLLHCYKNLAKMLIIIESQILFQAFKSPQAFLLLLLIPTHLNRDGIGSVYFIQKRKFSHLLHTIFSIHNIKILHGLYFSHTDFIDASDCACCAVTLPR